MGRMASHPRDHGMTRAREAAHAVRILATVAVVVLLALALVYASTVPEWCEGVAQRDAVATCATSGVDR